MITTDVLPEGAVDATGATAEWPPSLLDRWLAARSVVAVTSTRARGSEAAFVLVARAAMRSADARKLLRTLRWNLKDENAARAGLIRLEGPAESQAAAERAASTLAQVGLLVGVRRSGAHLHFEVNPRTGRQLERLRRFLDGSWLELGARAVAEQVARELPAGQPAEVHSNVSFTDADGNMYELDVLVLTADSALVVECKSGTHIEQCLPRFRDVCDVAGVDGAQAVYLGASVDPAATGLAADFHRLTILGPDQLADHLRAALVGPGQELSSRAGFSR